MRPWLGESRRLPKHVFYSGTLSFLRNWQDVDRCTSFRKLSCSNDASFDANRRAINDRSTRRHGAGDSGVVLVASGESIPGDVNPMDPETQNQKKNLGIGWALYSALGFGVMFWLLGIRIVPIVGAVQTVWLVRLTSVVGTALVMRVAGKSMALPAKPDVHWILGIGVLDTGAYLLNNWGMRLDRYRSSAF